MWMFSPQISISIFFIFGCKKLPQNFRILIITLFTCLIIWAILMFDSSSTVIHQGSFFPWIICYICSSILVSESSKILYLVILVVNFGISLLVYIVNFKLVGNSSFIYLGILSTLAIAFFVSLKKLDDQEKTLI